MDNKELVLQTAGRVTAATVAAAIGNMTAIQAASVLTALGGIAVSQGVNNAGKILVVGPDGNVTPTTMEVWTGGSY